MVYGFKTGQGSIYKFDEAQGLTTRTKLSSEGTGQGKTYEPHMCLFFDAVKFENLQIKFGGRPNYYFLLATYDSEKRVFNLLRDNVVSIPDGETSGVLVLNKTDNSTVGALIGQKDPAIGLTPYEMHYYPNGSYSYHTGNEISAIFNTKEEYDDALQAGLKALAAQESAPTYTPPTLG